MRLQHGKIVGVYEAQRSRAVHVVVIMRRWHFCAEARVCPHAPIEITYSRVGLAVQSHPGCAIKRGKGNNLVFVESKAHDTWSCSKDRGFCNMLAMSVDTCLDLKLFCSRILEKRVARCCGWNNVAPEESAVMGCKAIHPQHVLVAVNQTVHA